MSGEGVIVVNLGGQYNGTTMSATVGGNCEVIGIRNDFFESKIEDRVKDGRNQIIQGEYLGDVQIHRIISPDGPALKMITETSGENIKITFFDDRKYSINLSGETSPKSILIPFSNQPSFKVKGTN